ncbi:peptide/nickel transport system ATP-binding protein [Aureimonas altamirensis DSM 21988]|uniref:Peptide/nickel transport system ATP-binding protein n=1 Tax=Aureimonas altamirensis DSM 21988 TaxID=1121026 RepID=A0ABY1IN21_9HYPH|nr:ABC transporter ATP-binding protein [Aureimonas altamirensis]SHJ52890.1 peptide/nickel transport system ATP-binding protein [Aureimonas altamirensis DSM 21988]
MTGDPILSVDGLGIRVGSRMLVEGLSFDLHRGETLCIAGESGSGKSLTSLAIMGLLPQPGPVVASGHIRLGGEDITRLPDRAMRRIRGDRIAMIFQEPMTSLNPVLSIGRQLSEAIEAHRDVGAGDARKLALEALEAVRMPEAARRLNQYPHELSGGMRQRVMIAMALALEPDVLIADEPTTALDVTIQAQVLGLLKEIQEARGTSVILITHDMGVVAEMADRVVVMRQGRAVESGNVGPLFASPSTPYTRELLAAVPRMGDGSARLAVQGGQPVAQIRDLTVRFPIKGGMLGRTVAEVHAVAGVSFDIPERSTLSLVGESGCGKSTTAKAIAGLVPYCGRISVDGRPAEGLSVAERKALRRDVQMVFQDPFASLDPRMTVGDLVAEPLAIHGIGKPQERRDRVATLFERVGLSTDGMRRYPHQFSGGQRQRICIARALALRPKLIIADESVSALDVSVQKRVLELLRELQGEFGIAYLFISHDMAVVENMSDRVAVMYLGQIVEMGTAAQVFGNPRHAYTRRLMEAVPVPDPARRRSAFPRQSGDIPSAVRKPGDAPQRLVLHDVGGGHLVAGEASAYAEAPSAA